MEPHQTSLKETTFTQNLAASLMNFVPKLVKVDPEERLNTFMSEKMGE